MYHDLQNVYQWNGIKRAITEFVAKYLNGQQLKVKNQRLGGMIQDISIPTLNQDVVNMDYIIGCLILIENMILIGLLGTKI